VFMHTMKVLLMLLVVFCLLFGGKFILAVQHAGHSDPSYSSEIIPTVIIHNDDCLNDRDLFQRRNKLHLFTLQEQIDHKLAIIEHILQNGISDGNEKLVLVGHSIGAYIACQVRISWLVCRVILAVHRH